MSSGIDSAFVLLSIYEAIDITLIHSAVMNYLFWYSINYLVGVVVGRLYC